MVTWDDAADWYLTMVGNDRVGFNDLASATALGLADDLDDLDVLDLGCGEGHVARRLASVGARVVGVEPVVGLLDAARAREAEQPLGVRYLRGGAEDLTFLEPGSFDLVMAVLVLHHVKDLPEALTQVARVLRPGGRVIAVQPHPWSDHPGAAWVHEEGQPRRLVGDYTLEGYWREELPAGSELSTVRQIGWYHRTVATWINAMTAAGFVVSEVAEPAGAAPGRPDGGGPWQATPRFFALAATR